MCEEGCDFELWGLDRCVKLLKARKIWGRDCKQLQEDIIEFARQQAELFADGADIAFSLA